MIMMQVSSLSYSPKGSFPSYVINRGGGGLGMNYYFNFTAVTKLKVSIFEQNMNYFGGRGLRSSKT